MLFQLGSSVVLVWVFCCFSLGLLYATPPPPDGKVGIRVTEKFRFFRFTFNKFQPKDNSVQSHLHLLAMQLICDGQYTNWFTLHFTIYSIHVMANLSTSDCQTMWTIIFFTSLQCSSFVMAMMIGQVIQVTKVN